MRLPSGIATVDFLTGEDNEIALDGYRLTADGRWVLDSRGRRLMPGSDGEPMTDHGPVHAAITFAADVTALKATGAKDAEPASFTSWRVKFESGKGALIIWIDAIDMSDILSDSDVQEAGDIPTLRVRLSSWRPQLFLPSVYSQRHCGDLIILDGTPDGPEAVVRLDDVQHSMPLPSWQSEDWELRLDGTQWVELVRIAARAVGYPWFRALRTRE